MGNAPVITINSMSRYPGSQTELWERFINWQQEVYGPVIMRVPQRRQVDMYTIVRESPVFPYFYGNLHYENYEGWEEARKNPEAQSISGEFINWMKRGVIDFFWCAVYELVKSFRNEISNSERESDTRIENAPFLHLEAYRLSEQESEKYNKWFIDTCSNIFVPLFMKQTGLKGYDYFKYAGISVNYPNLIERQYPTYLNLVYFENIEAFEIFEKSKELDVCRKTLRDIFPGGLEYKWYVQYKILKSWRR